MMKRPNFWRRPIEEDSASGVFKAAASLFAYATALLYLPIMTIVFLITFWNRWDSWFGIALTFLFGGLITVGFSAMGGGLLSLFIYLLLRCFRNRNNLIFSVYFSIVLGTLLMFFPFGMLTLSDAGYFTGIPALLLAFCLTLFGHMGVKIYELFERSTL